MWVCSFLAGVTGRRVGRGGRAGGVAQVASGGDRLGRGGRGELGGRLLRGALGVDEVGQPGDLALDRLDRVTAELGEVAVVAAPAGGPGPVEALLQTGEPSLENPQAYVGVGAREEREPGGERVVLPGSRARVGDLLTEVLAAGGRDLVGDPLPAGDTR